MTELRLSEENERALADERDKLLRRFQLQCERMPLAYVVVDADNRVLEWNAAAERIFGYRKDEVLNTVLFDKFIPPSAKNQLETIVHRLQSGDMSAHSVNENLTKDGRTIICEWFNTPLFTEDGQFAGIFSLAQDITNQIETEEQLRQAHKMDAIGKLAGGVAHDFNNLLTVINGYCDMLLNAQLHGDSSWEMLNEIRKAGERSAALTRQLLAFSKKQAFAPKVFDLNDIVRDTEKLLRRLIGEDVQLVITFHSQTSYVNADASQLQQILLNLSINAREAMPRGGNLVIETKNVELDEEYAEHHTGVQPGEYVMLIVSDTGSGITAENRRRIFEPFFSTKQVGKGTGLGLAVVHGIVKQNRGHIEVTSEPECGASFKILLPRADGSTATVKSVDQADCAACASETILLVEDEEAVRGLTRLLLQERGYRVLEAGDAEEALRISAAHQETIHLLVTDVVLPGMGGRMLAEQLLTMHPEMRVLYVSGYLDDEIVRHGILQKQASLLEKPFTASDLLLRVQEVLSN